MQKITESNGIATYQNHRTEPYFTFLKNGQKTIEGRLRKGEYASLKPGDHIIVYNENETDSVEVLVKGVRGYMSIKDMLQAEPLSELLPDIKSIEDALAIYRRFYDSKEETQFGVIAIEVEVLRTKDL